MKALSVSLFENLRIEKEELSAINVVDIALLAPLYKKKTVALFLQCLQKEINCNRLNIARKCKP